MADTKITALTALTAADPANDVIPIVDVSDTSMAASGTTKKISVNNILGASGTATLASATISGDLTVDTSTLKVDSANNRVGILTASPAVALDVRGVINVNSGGSGGASQLLHTLSASSGGNYGQISNTGTNWALGYGASQSTVGTQSVIWDSSGNLSLASGNLVMSTAGKGIDFSATASGSGTMTSELLNDYEEGTFTIALTFGGGNTGMTTSFSTGQYTKIGRQVSVNGLLVLTAKGSSTGVAVISGLPFANGNSLDALSAVSLRLSNVSYVGSIQSLKLMNTATFNFEQLTEAGSNLNLSDANFSNTSDIVFNFTYNVA